MNMDKARSESRALLDKFGKDLLNVKIEKKRDSLSDKSSRKEKGGEICDTEFKTIMFKNAPRKDDMCLLLEKGSWN